MIDLDDREAYCVALIIANGGQIDYKTLRDVILEFKESFHGLNEQYVKYRLVKRILKNLVSDGLLSESHDSYRVNPDLEEFLVKKHASYLVKAIKNFTAYRKQHILEFDLSFTEETLLSDLWEDMMPHGLIDELKGAIDIHQRTDQYDAVITKCGRCIEIWLKNLTNSILFFPLKSQLQG